MTTPHITFGNLLLATRKARGKTQLQASIAIGIADTTLCGLEKGHNSPTFDVAIRISRYYKLPLDDMAEALKCRK